MASGQPDQEHLLEQEVDRDTRDEAVATATATPRASWPAARRSRQVKRRMNAAMNSAAASQNGSLPSRPKTKHEAQGERGQQAIARLPGFRSRPHPGCR